MVAPDLPSVRAIIRLHPHGFDFETFVPAAGLTPVLRHLHAAEHATGDTLDQFDLLVGEP